MINAVALWRQLQTDHLEDVPRANAAVLPFCCTLLSLEHAFHQEMRESAPAHLTARPCRDIPQVLLKEAAANPLLAWERRCVLSVDDGWLRFAPNLNDPVQTLSSRPKRWSGCVSKSCLRGSGTALAICVHRLRG